MNARSICIFILSSCLFCGCASIIPPTGGKKDTIPPKLVSVTPADSLLNTRVKKIEMHFDKYITVSDATKEVQISPILPIQPVVTALNKHVTIKIADTLLEDNTTYRLSFGNAIRDVHEGNPFRNYVYTFSTGNYFDSLQISGKVISAATGLPDTGIVVVLYNASKPDSAVVREKPKYIIKAHADGSFVMKGLPGRKFRIYALKDANDNLIYDGIGEEIGFYDKTITPGDSAQQPILLRIFAEDIDTTTHADTSSLHNKETTPVINTETQRTGKHRKSEAKNAQGLNYIVTNIDTSDVRKRSFDITVPVKLVFNKVPLINRSRIELTYDSSGTDVHVPVRIKPDTTKARPGHPATRSTVLINAEWKDNTVYTIKFRRGFAKDTSGADALPSSYRFRTMRDEDYGKLQVHLPTKYYGRQYLLMVTANKDTIYLKPVLDSIVNLIQLRPATYNFRIIVDKNGNGKWDTGDLFKKQQPEVVIPYTGGAITLKAGWENIIDFEQKTNAKPGSPPPK